MAQTQEEISNQILNAIQAQPLLAGLTSTSQVSIWSQFKDAIASVLQTAQQLGDVQEARLNTIANQAVPGTPAWLQRNILTFQYGDQIQINQDFTISYPTVDVTKQLITRCSIQENLDTREVLVKVAKGPTAATLTPLTTVELSSLKAYVQRIKFAGIHMEIISLQPDRISPTVSVYYSGEYDPAVIQANVEAAIQLFLQALPFDGQLYLSKLEDAIQAVAGVKDVALTAIICRAFTTTIQSAADFPVQRVYGSQAGYIIPEDTPNYTLADTITYIPA